MEKVIGNHQKAKKGFLFFICSVSAMGGLLFGYDWVVIGGAKPFYEEFFGIGGSPLLQGVAMTTALIGCLVGAMVAEKTTVLVKIVNTFSMDRCPNCLQMMYLM